MIDNGASQQFNDFSLSAPTGIADLEILQTINKNTEEKTNEVH